MTRPRRLLLALALLLVPWAGARPEGSGTVKGTVTTGPPGGRAVADAVVMIEGPPARNGTTRATMNQRQEAFVPHVLGVAVGTTVDFPNGDPVLHNVFSTSPAKKFDLGMYDQGETRSVLFDSPGVVLVRCSVHPRMTGYIVVHSNPYVAVTDVHGSYTISGVPPGTYKARIWHEALSGRTVPVVVYDGRVTPLDFALGPNPTSSPEHGPP
jgi:plastocyanin